MSLADALKKAGLKMSEPEKKPARGTKDKTEKGKKIHDHHNRTECEACKKNAPDVEQYNHTNRSLLVKWLCIVCADRYQINDDLRATAQSDFCKRGMFIRNYGHTKRS